MKKIFSLILSLCFLMDAPQAFAFGKRDIAKEKKFVIEVLKPEYGDQSFVSRWERPPSISVVQGNDKDRELVKAVVSEVNEALKPTNMQMRYEENNKRPNIKVFFEDDLNFDKICAKEGCRYVPGNVGYFYLWWHGRGTIDHGVVLISSVISGKTRNHIALEEITQSLGASNDTPLFKNSVFHSDFEVKPQHLSDLDKKVLVFLYTHVNAGDTSERISQELDKYWT